MAMTVTENNKSSYKLTGVTSAKTYKATYVAKTYKYVLHLNGGSIDTNETVEYTIEDIRSKKLPTPTKAGYAFVGWFTSPNFSNTKSESPVFGDTDFYAKWVENQYTLTFDYADKLANNTINFTYDQLPITLSVPKVDGYNFVKWTYNSNSIFSINKSNFNTLAFDDNNNATILAEWEESNVSVRNEYYLQNFDGGSYDLVETTTSTGKNGTEYKPENKAYTGYKLNTEETKLIASLTPNAVYREYHDLESYTASLHCYEDRYGEEAVKLGETNNFFYSNHNIELPYMTAKPCFTFVGWKNVNNERVSSIPAYVHENVDYFACFTQEAPVLGKDFEIERAGGTSSNSKIVFKNDRIKAVIKGTTTTVNNEQEFTVPTDLYVYFDGEKANNVVVMEEAGIDYTIKLYRDAPNFNDSDSLKKPLNIVHQGENESGSIQANVENLEIFEEDGTVIPFIKGSVIKNTLTGIYQLRYAEDDAYYASDWATYTAVSKQDNDATVIITVKTEADYYMSGGEWTIKRSGDSKYGNIEYRFGYKNGDTTTYMSYWISTTGNETTVSCPGPTMNAVQARISGNATYNPSVPVDRCMTQKTVSVILKDGSTTEDTISYIANQPLNTNTTFNQTYENYSKTGYKFAGWYDKNSSAGNKVTNAGTDDITIYAIFTAKDVYATINGFKIGLLVQTEIYDLIRYKTPEHKKITTYNSPVSRTSIVNDGKVTVETLFNTYGSQILEQIDSKQSPTMLADSVIDRIFVANGNPEVFSSNKIEFNKIKNNLTENADGTYDVVITPVFFTIDDNYTNLNYVSTLSLVKDGKSGNILMKFKVPNVFKYYKINITEDLNVYTLDLYCDDYHVNGCEQITGTDGDNSVFYVETTNYNDTCTFKPVYHATRTSGYHTDASNVLSFNNTNKLEEDLFDNVVTVTEAGFETKNDWSASEVDETTSVNTTTGTEE